MFRAQKPTLETKTWTLKTIFQPCLSSKHYFWFYAAEVTMGYITESRPVNVSFSFFYINSLPISN